MVDVGRESSESESSELSAMSMTGTDLAFFEPVGAGVPAKHLAFFCYNDDTS